MHTVYICIPARLIISTGATDGANLYGEVRCHTDTRTGAPVCTMRIMRRVDESQQRPLPANVGQRIGYIAQQHGSPDTDAEFFATFTHQPHNSTQPYLHSLRVPGLTPTTRIKLIASLGVESSSSAVPPTTARRRGVAGIGSALLQTVAQRCSHTMDAVGTVLPVVRHTAVFQHLLGRCALMSRPNLPTLCTLASDTVAGLLVTLLLLRIGHPYFHLTKCTEVVVVSVRQLLDALKGFPIGLKLNIELNNFLLGIFTYHIDLWVTFLVLIVPLLHWLFVPFVALGALGLSLQLAILSDLLVFISLHAHCFYIYVAVLYHGELAAIDALWRVLRGTRHNTLKGRVESHDYTNPQLYLATMFFASLLFLLPTVLLYYVVFAFLRFCVYCTTYVLIAIQRRVLNFPVYAIAVRVLNAVRNKPDLRLQIITDLPSGLPNRVSLTAFADCTDGPAQSAIITNDDDDVQQQQLQQQLPQMLSVFQFFMGLVRGHILGFILPLGKHT